MNISDDKKLRENVIKKGMADAHKWVKLYFDMWKNTHSSK